MLIFPCINKSDFVFHSPCLIPKATKETFENHHLTFTFFIKNPTGGGGSFPQ